MRKRRVSPAGLLENYRLTYTKKSFWDVGKRRKRIKALFDWIGLLFLLKRGNAADCNWLEILPLGSGDSRSFFNIFAMVHGFILMYEKGCSLLRLVIQIAFAEPSRDCLWKEANDFCFGGDFIPHSWSHPYRHRKMKEANIVMKANIDNTYIHFFLFLCFL